MKPNTNQEIERKFLVKRPPSGYLSYEHKEIKQGYLTRPQASTEIRIRKMGIAYTQTVKKGDGLIREEVEIELTKDQFETLWPITEGQRLEKTRYYIPHDDVLIELDVYAGNLDSLIVAEIEFDSLETSSAFVAPAWMEKEVTDEFQYRNVDLSRPGIPPEFRV